MRGRSLGRVGTRCRGSAAYRNRISSRRRGECGSSRLTRPANRYADHARIDFRTCDIFIGQRVRCRPAHHRVRGDREAERDGPRRSRKVQCRLIGRSSHKELIRCRRDDWLDRECLRRRVRIRSRESKHIT